MKEKIKKIICPNPNCGYKGKPEIKTRGDNFVGILLLLCGLWPGLLYYIFYKKTYFVCPKCGIQIREEI